MAFIHELDSEKTRNKNVNSLYTYTGIIIPVSRLYKEFGPPKRNGFQGF